MEWLYVLLTVLKFIGIAMLFLLIVLLFLLLLLLFGGIRYYVFVEKEESFSVRARVSFVKIVKFVFLSDDNINKSYVQILFFKFFKRGFSEKKSAGIKDEEKNGNELEENFFENESINKFEKISDFSGKEISDGGKNIKENETKKEKYLKNKEKRYGGERFNNIISAVKNIYDKFLYLKNYPEKDKIIKYTFAFTKELFFALKPEKFNVDLIIGFDDPSSTGKFIGFTAIISELLPFRLYISGDFENEVFKGDLEVKGKTNVFKIGIPSLKYIFKPPIWRLIKNRKG